MVLSNSSAARKLGLAASAFAMAAIVFAPTFNGVADAHVKRGSDLERYKGFVMKMKKNGSDKALCCNLHDGYGNLEEESYKDKEGKIHYRVLIGEDNDGKPFPGGPQWIEIPDDMVLSVEHAKKVCKELPPEAEDKDTCKPPPYNVFWGYVEVLLKPDKNPDPLSGAVFGKRTRPNEGSGQKPVYYNVFCYYPKPQVK